MPVSALAPVIPDTPAELLSGLSELIATELTPKVVDIDLKGVYAGDFLKQLGALGGLGSLTPVAHGGTANGVVHAIQLAVNVFNINTNGRFPRKSNHHPLVTMRHIEVQCRFSYQGWFIVCPVSELDVLGGDAKVTGV